MTSMLALLTGAFLAVGGPVTEVAIAPQAGQTTVLISVGGSPRYRDFTMQGPNRLVVDVMGATQGLPQAEYANVNRGGIVSIRTSQLSPGIVRLVFTLKNLVNYAISRDPKGLRIALLNPDGGTFAPWSSGTAAVATGASAAPAVAPAASALAAEGAAPSVAAKATVGPTRRASDDFTPTADPQQSQARRISITFTNSPIQDVLLAFSQFSGRSIVPGINIQTAGLITAAIHNQPWDVALNAILHSHGLVAREDTSGIIEVENITNLNQQEQVEPITTQAYRINYATASQLQTELQPILTTRGKITVGAASNELIVSDIQRVQNEVTSLLKKLDRRPPQVNIQTKIIYVDRTALAEMGVQYELKDSRGNQFNQLSGGQTVQNGQVTAVPQGQAVVELGGNSIAALGNAFTPVTNPTLSLLSSLVIGRYQLVSFLDALASRNLSDVQATPQVTVSDNSSANIMVGQIIPVRVIEAGTGANSQGAFPTAQVTTENTGIILTATPHVTATGSILMDISAQRSSATPAPSDAGFIKNTQQGQTRVLVQDGETFMFAGLTENTKTDVTTGIPLLMSLPVIGRLFRHTQHQTEQQDLIILVTPHIVSSPN